MDIIKHILFFIFNYRAYKSRAKRGEKIGWREIFISPTLKYAVLFGAIASLVTIGIYHSTRNIIKENLTIDRAEKIIADLKVYKDHTSRYPERLEEALNSPLDEDLQEDGWGSEFHYSLNASQQKFTLISRG